MRNLIVTILLAFGLAGLSAREARAEWLRAETEHFIIYGDTSEAALRRYAARIERFDGLLRAYYPIPLDHDIPKLEIYMAEGLRDMRRIWPDMSSSVGGFYSPNSGRIYAVVDMRSEMGDQVLFHEYAHHFMFQMASAAYPAWFIEGFAEYYSTAELRDDRIRVGLFSAGRMNSLTLAANEWSPLEDMLAWRVSDSGRYRGADYYAQAWALTHYMLSDPARTRALGQYLSAVAGGADSVLAMQEALGRTPRDLQNDLRSYLGGAIPVFTPQIRIEAGEITVTRLPASARDLIWIDVRLDRLELQDLDDYEDDEDRAKAAKERAAAINEGLRLAARWPGDPMAASVAARAHRLNGDLAAALAVLEPHVTPELEDAGLLRLTGTILLEQATLDTEAAPALVRRARGYLARALDIDPLNFRIYLALDDSRRGAAGYPNANDLSTLKVAVELAPQSFDARMRYAAVLMHNGRFLEVVAMLSPVANSPHESGGREAARAMLAAARVAAGLDAPEEAPTGPAESPGEPADAMAAGWRIAMAG